MILEFLGKYQELNDPHDRDHFKHLPSPPGLADAATKVVFVYGDPVNAAMSLFRRDYAFHQSIVLGSKTLRFPKTIEKFAGSGADSLLLERQFDQWVTRSSRDYDVLFVSYEHLWENLDEVLRYVGLTSDHVALFPPRRKRESQSLSLSRRTIAQLRTIYEPLARKMGQIGSVEVL